MCVRESSMTRLTSDSLYMLAGHENCTWFCHEADFESAVTSVGLHFTGTTVLLNHIDTNSFSVNQYSQHKLCTWRTFQIQLSLPPPTTFLRHWVQPAPPWLCILLGLLSTCCQCLNRRVLEAASVCVSGWLLSYEGSRAGRSVVAAFLEQTDGVIRWILCQPMVDEIADGWELCEGSH